MNSKNKNPDLLKEYLSVIQNIWYPETYPMSRNSLNSLISFFENIKEINCLKFFLKDLKPVEIPYNISLFHFIIYYSYPSKFPFVYKSDNTIFFGAFYGRNFDKLMISIPIVNSKKKAVEDLKLFLFEKNFSKLLQYLDIKSFLLRDIDDEFIRVLKDKKKYGFSINSLKELNYAIYNLNDALNLSGNKFSNLRWHLNAFKKANHKVEIVDLKNNYNAVVHLIGDWKKQTIKKRGFSYIDLRSDKMAANFFKEKSIINKTKKIVDFNEVFYRVLTIDGVISSFNFGYPLGIFDKQNVFAHSVGICDVSIPHLAEYAQYDFWSEIQKKGYIFINDGPTWRKSLEVYKNKFYPIGKKRYYWANISIF